MGYVEGLFQFLAGHIKAAGGGIGAAIIVFLIIYLIREEGDSDD